MADKKHQRLTAKMAVGLAAPHTWAASVTPVLLTGAIVYHEQGVLSVPLFLVLLVICVLMQSAVNTFNDYYDFKQGTDSKEDALDASDAVLLYNDIAPGQALMLGIGFLAAAALLAIYPVMQGGLPVLVIGLIGALVILLYSAGPFPLSHLPLGELVSGFVMGSLIPLGCYTALTGILRLSVMLDTLPVAYAIAMIMLTNNTCDVEKDVAAGRKTLPALLGRKRSVILYRILMVLWITLQGVFIVLFLPRFRTLVFPWLLIAVVALVIFHVGMIFTSKQARKISDPSQRPSLMKRVSFATALYGISLALALLA